MIKLIDLLTEKYNISNKQAEMLYFLAHDKKHVSKYADEINNVIKSNSEDCPIPLYRGFGLKYNIGTLSTGKYIGQVFTIGDILSMSENIKIAKNFGKDSGIIMKVVDGFGFCYWKWYIEQLKSPSQSDLDLIDVLSKEKEWLLSKESKFKIQDVESTEGYSMIICSHIH